MQYRTLGSTGIEVSEIVFGGGAVGGLLINQDDDTCREAIKLSLQAGINWIDTAASYGQGKSEETLGWLLKEIDQPVHVSTKFSIDTRNLHDIRGQIERSLEESLNRLQMNQVTLLQLHNRIGQTTDGRTLGISDILKPHGVFDCLSELQEMGMIHHFGITALGELPAITRVLKSGRPATAQVYYNLLNPTAGFTPSPNWPAYNFTGIMDTCRENDIGIMNIRVFSAGVLATDERHGREMPLTPGDSVESESAKAQLMNAALGTTYGSRAQTALRFALAQDKLSCVVIGIAELDYLKEALAAEEMGPLPQDAIASIKAAYESGLSS